MCVEGYFQFSFEPVRKRGTVLIRSWTRPGRRSLSEIRNKGLVREEFGQVPFFQTGIQCQVAEVVCCNFKFRLCVPDLGEGCSEVKHL